MKHPQEMHLVSTCLNCGTVNRLTVQSEPRTLSVNCSTCGAALGRWRAPGRRGVAVSRPAELAAERPYF